MHILICILIFCDTSIFSQFPLFPLLFRGVPVFAFYLDIQYNPKKYAHGFVVHCFVVVMQSFIMNSHEIFIHIHQGCFAGTGAIVRLPQCQWSKPDGYGKISQCITTTKHNKAKTVCIFLGICLVLTPLLTNYLKVCIDCQCTHISLNLCCYTSCVGKWGSAFI